MTPRTPLDSALTPDGEALTLSLENGEHVVRVRGELLMSSRVSGSEQAMARFAVDGAPRGDAGRFLVAGLGMGFTLRALLDALGAAARVEVIELLAEVVAWNRGPLAHHAQHALDDPRVTVSVGDLRELADGARGRYDAILVDVDNGPEAFTVSGNASLYDAAGVAALYRALVAGGTLVLWSAFRSPAFERRLRAAGFSARSETVRARGPVRRGARHTLFVAVRPAPGGPGDQQRGRGE